MNHGEISIGPRKNFTGRKPLAALAISARLVGTFAKRFDHFASSWMILRRMESKYRHKCGMCDDRACTQNMRAQRSQREILAKQVVELRSEEMKIDPAKSRHSVLSFFSFLGHSAIQHFQRPSREKQICRHSFSVQHHSENGGKLCLLIATAGGNEFKPTLKHPVRLT